MASQLAFHVNVSRCTGCKACQVACQDKNDLVNGMQWRRVVEYSGGDWVKREDGTYDQSVFAYYVSVACNHCAEPICVEVCPAKAMHKRDDGVVLVDESKCIGCRYCEWSCPYAGPQYDEDTGKMTKCNFCYDLLDQGEPTACVAACPSRALDFGELSDLQAKYGDLAEIAPLPEASVTKPSLVLTPGKNARAVGSSSGKLANPEEV